MDFDEDEDFYICELMAPETVTGEVTRVDKNTDAESDEDEIDNTYVPLADGDKYTYCQQRTTTSMTWTTASVQATPL